MSADRVELISTSYNRDRGAITAEKIYQVKLPGTDHTARDAESATDGTNAIDDIGDPFVDGDNAKCIGRRAQKTTKDQHIYDVTVSFSSKSEDQDQTEEDPLARDTDYDYSDSAITEPYFRDTDDNPVVNSAGEEFADLPQRERSIGRIRVTRNVSSFSDSTAQGFRDRVNSSSVTVNGTTYAAKTLRIAGWSASGPSVENGVTFWTETIDVAKNEDGWEDKFEDRGLNELDSGELKPILDSEDNPVVLPYPLNGSGSAASSPTATPSQITRKPYVSGAFPSLA